ncbi:hypothetical protein MOBT1_001913 [Malassezia obtusa]|uniref:Uncharacterized protein n=1 Tax=Malassezia obtusa TaxID=76774 RepID=A0AAF0E274_9BASI|nr:hypothetical protein MOBT1_001913 [Malassezia obtusa]
MLRRALSTARRAAEVVRLPASAFQPPNPAAHVHRRPAAQFRCDMFALQLYPLHLAVHDAQTSMPRALGPPWLPWPPRRETHSARHVRLANAARAALADDPARVRMLRTTVFVSKKQVHKLAVVRNRCRTRLLAALRALVAAEEVPVHDRYVYVFLANAPLYAAPHEAIVAALRRALAHVVPRDAPR